LKERNPWDKPEQDGSATEDIKKRRRSWQIRKERL
jgi:hypothetical protein